jgi:hypothetical protein
MNVIVQVNKFKARLVAKGYSQVEGVNFGEIFSHVAKLNSNNVLISMVLVFVKDQILSLRGGVNQ